jgi:hypothetical protein
MTHLLTLNTRGTDVMVSALALGGQTFELDDIYEQYGRLYRERGVEPAKHFRSSIRNELQRLSSDCLVFEKENRQMDLVGLVRRGVWTIRDGVRPLLMAAANEHGKNFVAAASLFVPFDGDYVEQTKVKHFTHVIGNYAQQQIMDAITRRGYRILEDTSQGQSYDFTFRLIGDRTASDQIMESKGTQQSEIDVSLSNNEHSVFASRYHQYWLGVVTDIKIESTGIASGGDVFITSPEVLSKWKFINNGARLRRIVQGGLI